jgi:PEP-CTERM motif
MKRFSLAVAAISAVCLTFQSAQASLLFSEGFNYTSGSGIGGNVNPGSGTAWTGNDNINVNDGSLSYAGLASLGGNSLSVAWGVSSGTAINDPAFGTAVNSGQLYYSFLMDMTVTPVGTTTGSGDYLTALNATGSGPGGSGDVIDNYISTSGVMKIRSMGSYSSGYTLTEGQTYLMVLGLDYDAGTASLWVDPTPGDSMPAATESVTGLSLGAVQDVGFKAQTSGGMTAGTFLFDDLRIGTTWADVTPMGVPEPSTFALVGMGILGLISSARRRVRR